MLFRSDRGAVWALVHPRGGGELGRQWYLDGKLQQKRNTFTDTIACVEHLVAECWGHPDKVAIRGASAGGLLVGACVTMRPDLFRAAVAEVPFVDVVTTMSDPSLPLTVTEWEEWGDPRTEPAASYMLTYSPYDNTVAADYPAPKQGEWVAKDFKFHTGETMPALKLAYTTIGAPTGQPVLLLHGTTGSAASRAWKSPPSRHTFIALRCTSW